MDQLNYPNQYEVALTEATSIRNTKSNLTEAELARVKFRANRYLGKGRTTLSIAAPKEVSAMDRLFFA